MPCGGIQPMVQTQEEAKTIKDKLHCTKGGCWVCGLGGAHHFMHEWDTFIHARCAIKYLAGALNPRTVSNSNPENGTEIHPIDNEAQIIIEHQHDIFLNFSLEEKGEEDAV